MYERVDPNLISTVDIAIGEADSGQGNPRTWGQFTRYAQVHLAGEPTLTQDAAELTVADLRKRSSAA